MARQAEEVDQTDRGLETRGQRLERAAQRAAGTAVAVMTFQYRHQNPPPSRQALVILRRGLAQAGVIPPGSLVLRWRLDIGILGAVGPVTRPVLRAACLLRATRCVCLHGSSSCQVPGRAPLMADAQAGRAILELGTRENRSTSQARFVLDDPCPPPLTDFHPINQPCMRRGPRRRRQEARRKKKRRPSSWDPWRVLGPGWLDDPGSWSGWLARLARWPGAEQSSKKVASRRDASCEWALWPCGPDPSTLSCPPSSPTPPSTLFGAASATH